MARKSRSPLVIALSIALALCTANATTAPANAAALAGTTTYVISGEPVVAEFSGPLRPWDGAHRFTDVFCLRMPQPALADRFARAMYNDYTLYHSRVDYPSLGIRLYIATSRVPTGLDHAGELAAQEARIAEVQAQYPGRVRIGAFDSSLGPGLMLRMRNVIDTPAQPFPFVLTFQGEADAPAASMSAHRLFQNNGSRIELGALRTFGPPLEAAEEAAAAEALDVFVDQAAGALVQCTDFMRLELARQPSDAALADDPQDVSR